MKQGASLVTFGFLGLAASHSIRHRAKNLRSGSRFGFAFICQIFTVTFKRNSIRLTDDCQSICEKGRKRTEMPPVFCEGAKSL